jgi:hypothetical protein
MPEIDKKTTEPRAYLDIKSVGLRDVLKNMLRGVKAVSLEADKPSVPFLPFYNFFSGFASLAVHWLTEGLGGSKLAVQLPSEAGYRSPCRCP